MGSVPVALMGAGLPWFGLSGTPAIAGADGGRLRTGRASSLNSPSRSSRSGCRSSRTVPALSTHAPQRSDNSAAHPRLLFRLTYCRPSRPPCSPAKSSADRPVSSRVKHPLALPAAHGLGRPLILGDVTHCAQVALPSEGIVIKRAQETRYMSLNERGLAATEAWSVG